MKFYLLPSNKILEFIEGLSQQGPVYYPQMVDGKAHLTRFEQDKDFLPEFKAIRTAENIKHFFLPSRDTVAGYPKDAKISAPHQVLFGVKNCDLRGVDVYDRVFLRWEPVDPLYKARRDNTIIISADCPEPEDTCFCNLVGLNPYAEGIADLNFTVVESGLLFEVFSEKGKKLINQFKELFSEPNKGDEKERQRIRRSAVQKLNKFNERPFGEDLPSKIENADQKKIHQARNDCVECLSCLYSCPTCYCFLLSDYKKGKIIERVRVWDGCYYAAYARVGGGMNPRPKFDKRFWNRFLCKFSYFHQYEGLYACTGCGRCNLGCMAKIDIREILWQL